MIAFLLFSGGTPPRQAHFGADFVVHADTGKECASTPSGCTNPNRPYFDGYGNEYDYTGKLIAHGSCDAWAKDIAFWKTNYPTAFADPQAVINGTQQQIDTYCVSAPQTVDTPPADFQGK